MNKSRVRDGAPGRPPDGDFIVVGQTQGREAGIFSREFGEPPPPAEALEGGFVVHDGCRDAPLVGFDAPAYRRTAATGPIRTSRGSLGSKACTSSARARGNQKSRHTPRNAALLKKHRLHGERVIGLFDRQSNAAGTQCRNLGSHLARRRVEVLAHNGPRFINKENNRRIHSPAHPGKVG